MILRPNAVLAARTTDVTRIYNGEIVFKDVDVERPDMGTRTRTTTTGFSLWKLIFGH